jgi:hypothetical protein
VGWGPLSCSGFSDRTEPVGARGVRAGEATARTGHGLCRRLPPARCCVGVGAAAESSCDRGSGVGEVRDETRAGEGREDGWTDFVGEGGGGLGGGGDGGGHGVAARGRTTCGGGCLFWAEFVLGLAFRVSSGRCRCTSERRAGLMISDEICKLGPYVCGFASSSYLSGICFTTAAASPAQKCSKL